MVQRTRVSWLVDTKALTTMLSMGEWKQMQMVLPLQPARIRVTCADG